MAEGEEGKEGAPGQEGAPPPGWHPDPWGGGGQRWWDGTQWTGHVAPAAGDPAAREALRPSKTSGFAIASLVFGILGGPLLSIPFGLIARRRIARSGGSLGGMGMATAGIALGCLWLAVIALVVVLSAAGVLDEKTNAERFRGEERSVAVVIDRFEEYSDEERFRDICRSLFTPSWAQALESGGQSCEEFFDEEVGGRMQAEIDIEDITIDGPRARVSADEAGDDLRVDLVRQGGSWKIDRFR